MTLSAAPFLPDGTVYGTLLNFRHEQALWAARATEPPYKAPPQAPVLFIKTANTFSAAPRATPSSPKARAITRVGARLPGIHAKSSSPAPLRRRAVQKLSSPNGANDAPRRSTLPAAATPTETEKAPRRLLFINSRMQAISPKDWNGIM